MYDVQGVYIYMIIYVYLLYHIYVYNYIHINMIILMVVPLQPLYFCSKLPLPKIDETC